MSVFRRRRVYRDFGDTRPIGSASVVTASLATAAIVFAGTAVGSTPGVTGSASGSIVFGGGTISSANLENSGVSPVAFAGTAVGVRISSSDASGSIVFAGTARPRAAASGTITFAGSATVGTTFTMDAAGSIVFAGSVAGQKLGIASGLIVFNGAAGTPVVTDGTIEAEARAGEITFDGTASGTAANIVQNAIVFDGTATATRVASTVPIDRILISVEPIYDIYITVKVSGS